MDARLGDTLRAPSEKVGQPDRLGEIVEILGNEEHPMYKVRWQDAHETVIVPGPDVTFDRRL